MMLLDLTLPTPAENLALDEALLDQAEAAAAPIEFLRVWESPQEAVVVGRSSRWVQEVDAEQCRRRGVPILRRCSGGAAVMIGPGCLMYAVVLSYELRPELRMIDSAHRFVLGKVACALQRCGVAVTCAGTSDVALDRRKVSGNSLRCKRDNLLYHGTILCGFATEALEHCLRSPPRQPDYRGGRAHSDFVANLPLTCDQARSALIFEWGAVSGRTEWPRAITQRLVEERYSRDEWNLRM
jgi:lipoate-protein ligase A